LLEKPKTTGKGRTELRTEAKDEAGKEQSDTHSVNSERKHAAETFLNDVYNEKLSVASIRSMLESKNKPKPLEKPVTEIANGNTPQVTPEIKNNESKDQIDSIKNNRSTPDLDKRQEAGEKEKLKSSSTSLMNEDANNFLGQLYNDQLSVASSAQTTPQVRILQEKEPVSTKVNNHLDQKNSGDQIQKDTISPSLKPMKEEETRKIQTGHTKLPIDDEKVEKKSVSGETTY
jgi:hypothetical protein